MVLVSCEKNDIYSQKEVYLSEIPLNFRFYVRSFMSDAQAYGWDIDKIFKVSFEMKELSDDLAGQCTYFTNNIAINSKFWYDSDLNERKRIVYHELGHCFLKRKSHNDNCLPNGYPASLMGSKENKNQCNTSASSMFFCPDFTNYYLSELFGKAKGLPAWGDFTYLSCNYSSEDYRLNLYYRDPSLGSEGGSVGSTGSAGSNSSEKEETNAVLKLLKENDVVYTGRIRVTNYYNFISILIADCIELGDKASIRIESDSGKVYTSIYTRDQSTYFYLDLIE